NFQHLAPLAQAVDELQAVSGLAQAVDELQAVSELAPYVQALLDSRIVDHNLDVANPANGLYVRWDSGLQICWHTVSLDTLVASNRAIEANWTLPASFSSSARRFAGVTWVRSASTFTPPVHEIGGPHVWNVTAQTMSSIRIYATGDNLFAA